MSASWSVWQDRNLDGVAQLDELTRFKDKVASLDIGIDYLNPDKLVDGDGDGQVDDANPAARFLDGSMIYGTTEVTLATGATTTAYDMAFASDDKGIRQEADGTFTLEGGDEYECEDDGGPAFYLITLPCPHACHENVMDNTYEVRDGV